MLVQPWRVSLRTRHRQLVTLRIRWSDLLGPFHVRDVSICELLQSGDPLFWPGDRADPEDKRNFWSSLLDRATLL